MATIGELVSSLSKEDRELMDLVVGAAINDLDISEMDGVVARYDALSQDVKNVIDFVVGNAMDDQMEIAHGDAVDEFLAHYGVKGMKWGVRKDPYGGAGRLSKSSKNTKEGRREARDKVKRGSATLGEAHLAGVKSTGHRVTNAVLGDKKYWGTIAKVAGVAAVGAGVSLGVPHVLPTSLLDSAADVAGFGIGIPTPKGDAIVTSDGVYKKADFGKAFLTAGGLAITAVGAGSAQTVALVTSVGRAVRGNARIDKSYAKLGDQVSARQVDGSKRVQKTLRKQGSIRRSRLRHEDTEWMDDFLAHYGIKGMKWGIRRKNPSGAPLSEDAATARAILAKKSSSVSSSDIQTALNRMRLEQQFKEIQAQMTPATRSERAKRFVGKLLSEIGSNEVNRVSKAAVAISVEKALQKGGKVNLDKDFAKEVGKRIVPKKK